MEHCIGNFEFSVVPKGLFTSDGQPLTCTDKSAVMHAIEKLVDADQLSNQTIVNSTEDYRVIVIDGMAVVNQISKTKDIQSCSVS